MRKSYEEQAKRGIPSAVAQFSYAHALIKSKREDVRLGIFLLEGRNWTVGGLPVIVDPTDVKAC